MAAVDMRPPLPHPQLLSALNEQARSGSQKDSGGVKELERELARGADLANSAVYDAVLLRLHKDSGGAAANLASDASLVRQLFARAARLQDAALLLLFKVATWDMARERFGASLAPAEQVEYLQQARRDCSSATNTSMAAQTRTGFVVSTLALVATPSDPCVFSSPELQAVVALASRCIKSKAEQVRSEMQHAMRAGSAPPAEAGNGANLAQHRNLQVHEVLTALLHLALAPANHPVLLAARSALEEVLESWQGFATTHPFPIAVRLKDEEVLCSSDLDLCVGLIFTLTGVEESRAELEAVLSAMALRGLKNLVKHSTSATSRRFGGKALYLLSTSTASKSSALLNLAENMDNKQAFAGFPLRDINSPAIRWQGERQSQAETEVHPHTRFQEQQGGEEDVGAGGKEAGVARGQEGAVAGVSYGRAKVMALITVLSEAVGAMGQALGLEGRFVDQLTALGESGGEGVELGEAGRLLVEGVSRCQQTAGERKQYADAADRMLHLAHERHAALRGR